VDGKYLTPWEGIGLLVVFGGPIYALAAQRTYAALVRRGSVWRGRRARVAATLSATAVLALPIQFLVWSALGRIPLGAVPASAGLVATVVVAFIPPIIAAAICFPLAWQLLGRRRAPAV
jgi:hypothetical protein